MGASGVQQGRWAVTRSALRSGRLRRLLLAFLVFNIVEWGTYIAILVWAFDAGGLRLSTLVAVAQLVPAALLAPVIAAWSGRRNPQVALVAGYTAQAVTFAAAGIALLARAHSVVVVCLAVLSAIAITMTRPVHNSVLPRISRTTGELTVGNAATGTAEGLAILLGPLSCAVLIGWVGTGGVLAVMGLACATCALLTLGLHLTDADDAPPMTSGTTERSAMAILRSPAARTLTSLVSVEQVLVGAMDILLVVIAIDLLSMDQSGPPLLNAAIGVGALVGAGTTLALTVGQRVAPALIAGALLTGAAFAMTSLATTAWLASALLVACGAGKVVFDVALRTLVQRALPEHLLTAVFGVLEAVTMGALALGSLLVPVLVSAVGIHGAIMAAGLLLPLAALLVSRPVLRIDRSVQVPVDVAELLAGVPILSVIAPRVLDRLAIEARPQVVPAGQVVVEQGAAADTFYVIRSGSATVSIDGQHVRDLGPGAWFGELALLHDTPRTATVAAATDLDLLTLDRGTFLAFVAHVPRAVEAADEHARRTYL